MTLAFAIEVLKAEAAAIRNLVDRLDDRFTAAVERIAGCTGTVVVTGMGKSGIIGEKISATLASTGTKSIFLHPAEAIHGDLGRVVAEDVVIALSNSGETDEISRLLPLLKRIPVDVVGITGRPESTLGQHAQVVLDIGRVEEACALGLAPSVSTTAMLALGDALALTISKERKFSREEYALFHPGGSLGRQLLTVREIMRVGEAAAVAPEDSRILDVLLAIGRARAGSCAIVDRDGRLTGLFTDGDLRRHLLDDKTLTVAQVRDVMTPNPVTASPDMLAAEAAGVMRGHKIDELPVVDAERRPVGMLDVQDLLETGLV